MSKISIIIPVYNTEKYLRECLDSALQQTLQDLEVIIINDASTDSSQVIIDEYAAKDARVHCIQHSENLGQGEARNKGIAAATAKYITFLDSDDWIESHCYETVIQQMEEVGANLGYFGVELFEQNTEGRLVTGQYKPLSYSPHKITWENIDKILSIMCNKVFHLLDVQKDILRLPMHLKLEDEEFWFKYISETEPLAIGINQDFYHYRQHSASTMGNPAKSRRYYPQIVKNIYHYLEEKPACSIYFQVFYKFILMETILCYKKIGIEGQSQYCREMQDIFQMCNLSMKELLQFNPKLMVFYIEDAEVRDYFLEREDELFKQEGWHRKLREEKWYRFGRLSRKRKLWAVAKVLSKRLRVYPLLRPFARLLKALV